ncbi:MAG: HDOD domain-containing protein [Myxococcota bacterium]
MFAQIKAWTKRLNPTPRETVLIEKSYLTRQVLDRFYSPDYEPLRLPSVAMQLMELSKNPDTELQDIQATLEQDPLLVARVIQIASSPIYARGGRDGTGRLRDVLVRLGRRVIVNVVMQAALSARIFRDPTYQHIMDQLSTHSVVTARAAEKLCATLDLSYSEAFLAGLLHDIGAACLVATLADLPDESGQGRSDAQVWQMIEILHTRAGSMVCELWGLPSTFAEAARHHHDPRQAGEHAEFASIVCLAEALAIEAEAGWESPSEDGDRTPEDVLSALREQYELSPKLWSELVDDVRTMKDV